LANLALLWTVPPSHAVRPAEQICGSSLTGAIC